ncbi:group III truncated hemoglobin [Radicibacter daui]|uniref:group III truncated hemoglobin n=1 Tax=Radicibacter daui TaxID=3064829 RepID=UPI004046CB12
MSHDTNIPLGEAGQGEHHPAASRTRQMMPNGRLRPDGLDEALITRVVYGFYDAVREDALIGPVFADVIADSAWPDHLATMVDFWSSVLLGTRRYDGRPMPKHMALPQLADEHFTRWLELFGQTVHRLCPEDAAALFIDRAERIAQSFRMNLAYFRGGDPMAVKPMLIK